MPKLSPNFVKALPFYLVFFNIPLIAFVAMLGGWWISIAFIYFAFLITLTDLAAGLNVENLDPLTEDHQLFWYTLVTKLWPFAQIFLIYFMIYLLTHYDYDLIERVALMIVVGYSAGIAGIVIAHELIHRPNRFERFLGDILLGTVLYGHFRSEHVLVHHRYVGTPRDAVTARYNEGLYRYFLRVIPQSFISAFETEANLCKRMGKPIWHRSNPFYLYFGLSLFFILLAFVIGGWHGIVQFWIQAIVAILLLETTNYIEHYGLCRIILSNGKYEHVHPRHSWNANQTITNYLMINLQRHSDHHYKPLRRFPLLQALEETEAPQLPHGYILMAMYAFSPYHWRNLMNPRVRRWRSMYYPQITDWTAYNKGTNPWPK